VGRADRASPVAPIRPEIGLDDLRPNPSLIPIGDITQFEFLVYGDQGRPLQGDVASRPTNPVSVQPFNDALAADRIQQTLISLRGRIDL
jgi:hypothetical protein